MIYTVTLNPSLDYMITVKDFTLGKTNRTQTEAMMPGGKGINVSIMLKNLGVESTALGFTAGFTGEEIESMSEAMGIRCEFIRVSKGCSRINIKLKNSEGTEINGQGPVIGEEELDGLLGRLDELQDGDGLVLAGSVPKGIEKFIYEKMLKRLENKKVLTVVDTTGDALLHALDYKPFLIKPNQHELGELFGVTLNTREDVVPYAKRLQALGARNVLVSLAGKGAVLAAENGEIYMQEAPKGKVKNAVGAGDSMVAGFLAGWLEGGRQCYEYAFRMAVAAGSASAFSESFAEKEEVRCLFEKMG